MKSNVCEVVSSFQELEDYQWESSVSRTEFLEGFQKRVEHLRKCNVTLSEEYVGLRLLKASNLAKLGGSLVSIRCNGLGYSDVRSLIMDMFQDQGESIQYHHSPEQPPTISGETINNPKHRGWTEDGIHKNRVKHILVSKPKLVERPCKNNSENKGNSRQVQCDDPANIVNFVNTLRHGKNPQNEIGCIVNV